VLPPDVVARAAQPDVWHTAESHITPIP
jgi:hypothetical protein